MKTVYSLVTKPINQNVAIIRISGPETFKYIKSIFPDYKEEANTVCFKKLYLSKEFIDDILLLTFVKPNSFTGENVIEIQCHGSMFVVNKILSSMNKFGLTQSDPGEFMKQAYMNNKIDFIQAESINALILSENKTLAKQSSLNLDSFQSNFIKNSLSKIENIVSHIQVSIDYPENEDIPKYSISNIKKEILNLKQEFEKIIFDSQRLIKYSKGIVISLIGIPNAGKSTLLNLLSKEDRAIVSNVAGTTRDFIETIIYIDGVKVTLRDTAGIKNKTKDIIEQEGIKKSKESIANSDLIILLIDGTKNILKQEKLFEKTLDEHNHKLIKVFSKSDIKKNTGLSISSKDKNFNKLLNKINSFIKKNIFDNDKNNNSILVTQNQVDNFNAILEILNSVLNSLDKNISLDIVAFELENIAKKMNSILGIELDQDYLINLFSKFCIGK